MADKLRRQFPIKITFVDGEQPTAAKMNALSSQTRNGMGTLEKAIGDLWNSSGDATLNSYPLQIPNLARLLGENKYLNPALVPVGSAFEFTEDLGLRYENKNTGYLLLPPSSSTLTIVNDGGAFTTSGVANESDVSTVGTWWVENSTGKFRTAKAMDANAVVTYTVDPTTLWIPGQKTLPGIIPDSRQTTFTGCKITFEGGKYYLHFPPRQPLTLSSTELPSRYPSTAEAADANNLRSTAGVGTKKYWQHTTTALAGSGDSFYRYALPEELQSIGLGEEIPRGTLHLWNLATDSIIEDVIFKMPAPAESVRLGFQLEVSSTLFDFGTVDTSSGTQLEADYSSTGLVLITCASPVTRSIWNLMNLFMKHDHSNKGTLEPSISHDDLRDSNPTPAGTAAPYSAPYPPYVRHWRPSKWINDSHTSLLSRSGAQATAGRERDLYNNAMLGHLLLANADTTGAENYLSASLPDTSFRLYFGNTDANSPNMYATVSGLMLDPTGSKKVSIGTLSPLSKLSLAGNMAIGATYAGSAAAPSNGLLVEGITRIGTTTGTAPLNVKEAGSGDVAFLQSDLYAANLRLRCNDLLGGPVPVELLLVADSTLVEGHVGTTTNHPLAFLTNNTTKMTILANGNVGINHTNPLNQLHIQNTTGGYQQYIYSSGGNWGGTLIKNQGVEVSLQAATDSSLGILGTETNHGLRFRTNGTPVGQIFNTGHWYIGAAPVDQCFFHVHVSDVSGTLSANTVLGLEKAGDCHIQMLSPNTSTAGIIFGDPENGDIGRIQYNHNTPNALEFYTNNTLGMKLTSTGELKLGAYLSTAMGGNLSINSNLEDSVIIRQNSSSLDHRNNILFLRNIYGNNGANSAVTTGTILGGLGFGGYDSTTYRLGRDGGAEIVAYASENWTASAHGTGLSFFITKNTNSNAVEALSLKIDSSTNGVKLTGPFTGATLLLEDGAAGDWEISGGASAASKIYTTGGAIVLWPMANRTVVLPSASSNPTSPNTGSIYFYESGGTYQIRVYLNGAWRSVTLT